MKVILLAITMLLYSVCSNACTMCNSKTATDVRAMVFAEDFYKNLFFTVLPFILFAGITSLIHKSGKASNNN